MNTESTEDLGLVAELQAQEAIIAKGFDTFQEVGKALLIIRDRRLYRAEFETFEDYCKARWQMTRRRANQLIGASETVQDLGTMVPILPATERQARPLTKLPAKSRPAAWKKAVATAPNGKVTAKHVEHVVNSWSATPETEAEPILQPERIPPRYTKEERWEQGKRSGVLAFKNIIKTLDRFEPESIMEGVYEYIVKKLKK